MTLGLNPGAVMIPALGLPSTAASVANTGLRLTGSADD